MGKMIRRPNRLHHYDYSSCGVYFITICAKDRQSIFGQVIVGPSIARLPTVAVVIQQMKGYATKLAGCVLWQSRYYDHVVRDQADYNRILRYMEYNPARWTEDQYYV